MITKVSSVLSYRDRTDEDAEVRKGEDARDRTGDVYVAPRIIMKHNMSLLQNTTWERSDCSDIIS